MALEARTRTLLVKLLGLSGSVHDAEALAAIRKAGELVREAGMTWADIVTSTPVTQPPPIIWREPTGWLDAVGLCLVLPDAPLSPWDRRFLISISQRTDLTERQQIQLDRITDACRLYAYCAA
jgi:hypothetical protein